MVFKLSALNSTDPQNTITRRVKFVVRHDGVRDTFYFDKHSDPDSMRGFILTRKAADALIVNFTVEQGEAYGTLAIDAPPVRDFDNDHLYTSVDGVLDVRMVNRPTCSWDSGGPTEKISQWAPHLK